MMNLNHIMLYMYFMDGSKQKNDTVGQAIFAVAEGLERKSHYRLSDEATIFAAKVTAVKEVIADALKKGLSEIDVYLDLRSAMEVLNNLMPQQRTVGEIKILVQHSSVKIFIHWIKQHIGDPDNGIKI